MIGRDKSATTGALYVTLPFMDDADRRQTHDRTTTRWLP
jgi:hypothetical protein